MDAGTSDAEFGIDGINHAEQLRTELLALDTELSEATAALQAQRSSFVQHAAEHDGKRAEQSKRYREAWQMFEMEKQCMEAFHRELSEEQQIVSQLERECNDLEKKLGMRLQNVEQEPACMTSIDNENVALLNADINLSGANNVMKPEIKVLSARHRLQKPLRSLSANALGLAEQVVFRTEQRLEQAECSIALADAALLGARQRRQGVGVKEVADPGGWRSEAAALQCALVDAEEIASKQLELSEMRRERDLHQCEEAQENSDAAVDLATLRRAIVVEIQAGLATALADVASPTGDL